MRVVVTGGAGYIGSVVTETLVAERHEVTVYDDFSEGHRDAVVDGARVAEGDIGDRARLATALRVARAEAVVHMAAVCQVGESVSNPAKYYRVNLTGSLAVLDAMHEAGVRRLVFSSTAAVYGEPAKQPIEEDDPTAPSNPYGETKLAFERALAWHGGASGLRSIALRYFNAAGASERAGERHHPETHLIPLALQAAAGRRPALTIHGDDYPTRDGTCVRDYVHVLDLAAAHVLAVHALADGAPSAVFNLGCGGDGYTVREVIDTAERVTGRRVPVTLGPRRPGDPAVLIASAARIREVLGWRPRHQDLAEIIGSAWRYMQTRAS